MVCKPDPPRPPVCIFTPSGRLTADLYAGDAADPPALAVPSHARISPPLLRLAAAVARGQVALSAVETLSLEGRRGVALLAVRIAQLDNALKQLIDTIPGNCPAQAYHLLGEVFAGGVAAALDAQAAPPPAGEKGTATA